MGACALVNLGRTGEARAWMARAIAIDPEDSMLRYNCTCMAAQLGDIDEALAHLEKFIPYAGQEHKAWIAQDPDMDPLRTLPRFRELVDSIDRKPGVATAS